MGESRYKRKIGFETLLDKNGGRAIYMMRDGQIPIHELNKLFKNEFLYARREGFISERWTGPDTGLKLNKNKFIFARREGCK